MEEQRFVCRFCKAASLSIPGVNTHLGMQAGECVWPMLVSLTSLKPQQQCSKPMHPNETSQRNNSDSITHVCQKVPEWKALRTGAAPPLSILFRVTDPCKMIHMMVLLWRTTLPSPSSPRQEKNSSCKLSPTWLLGIEWGSDQHLIYECVLQRASCTVPFEAKVSRDGKKINCKGPI